MKREMILMKKWIPSLAVGAALTMSTTICAAAVPSSALVAGGIEYGASADYVQQVYGTPTEVETKHHSLWNGEVTEYEYGDSFELKFVDGYVRHIEISRHNGIKTAAGIEVGSTLDAVKAAYGEPNKIRGDKYIYYCDEDKSIGLVFEIENNKVDEIEMGYLD